MVSKRYYNDNNLRNGIQNIIRQIFHDKWNPDVVLGISRGGLYPAVLLSQYLEIPLLPICYHTRDFSDVINTLIPADLSQFNDLLVVDDICDSGATFAKLDPIIREKWGAPRGMIPEIRYAALFHNITNESEFEPQYYDIEINKLDKDEWIVFPYEDWWADRS